MTSWWVVCFVCLETIFARTTGKTKRFNENPVNDFNYWSKRHSYSNTHWTAKSSYNFGKEMMKWIYKIGKTSWVHLKSNVSLQHFLKWIYDIFLKSIFDIHGPQTRQCHQCTCTACFLSRPEIILINVAFFDPTPKLYTGVAEQIFSRGARIIRKMTFCEFSKNLLYKSSILGGSLIPPPLVMYALPLFYPDWYHWQYSFTMAPN